MRKLIAFLIISTVCCTAMAGTNMNFNGVNDTSKFVSFKADTLRYSKVFNLTDNEDISAAIMSADTNSAGFGSDSIAFEYGYRIGFPVYNSSSRIDTIWSMKVLLDTFKMDNNYSSASNILIDTTTSLPMWKRGLVDTTNITGYAYNLWSPWIKPWGVYIQFWVKGIDGNKIGGWVKTHVAVMRRLSINTTKYW